jgi:sigma-B regulation protein RsbU (phosphoserine phosphatase)
MSFRADWFGWVERGGVEGRRCDRAWLLLALAITTLTALADAALQSVTFIGMLISGPLLAAARLPVRPVAGVGGYALVLAVALGAFEDIIGSADHLLRCLIICVGGGFAVLTAAIRTRREGALMRMTQVAHVAQEALLRPLPASVGGIAFAGRYRSATAEAHIGGDLFDVAVTPYGLRLIVGDVKGHGLPAVQLAAAVLRAFHAATYTTPDLADLAKSLDVGLADRLDVEDFVTVVLAEFTLGELRLVNCGHPAPLRLARPGAGLQMLDCDQGAPPLGLSPDPAVQRVRLAAGERLLFYTDALIEARDASGTMFDLDERTEAALAAPSLDCALDQVLDLLDSHTCGHLHDDLALVLAQPLAQPVTQAVRASGDVLTGIDTRPS